MSNGATHIKTLSEAISALRSVVICLRAGRFKHDDYAVEIEHVANGLDAIHLESNRAKLDLRITAAALEMASEQNAANEIRKQLEKIP